MSWNWETVALLLAAVIGSGGVASLVTVRATARRTTSEAKKAEQDADKADADARKVISEATLTLMQPLISRAEGLEEKLRQTELELVAAKRAAQELTRSLEYAQAETQQLRGQVDRMAKDMSALQAENERLQERREQ